MLENAEIVHELSAEQYLVYSDPGDVIEANVAVQNGLNKLQQFNLMIYLDGIPVAFEVDGKLYISYSVELKPKQKTIAVKFEKDFAQYPGCLDFIMSYTENLHGI